MTIQITIIGLGQIGASIGLALVDRKTEFRRIGHDKDFGLARLAEKKGAVDKVVLNLPGAVSDADIIILAVPIDQVHPILELIGPDLRENCVILDTSPVKQVVLDWAKELLPEKIHFIGLTPVINGLHLNNQASGIDAAQEDLFKNGLMAVASLPGTPERAIRLAVDFSTMLGADHMFVDPVEIDSFMSALHILPQLSSAAMLQATSSQPGWIDARKVSGRPFAEQINTISHHDDPESLAVSAVQARQHVLRVMDNLIQSLYDIRDDIESEDIENLTSFFEQARIAHVEWLGDRLQGQWSNREMAQKGEMPGAGEMFGRLIGIRPKKKDDPKR